MRRFSIVAALLLGLGLVCFADSANAQISYAVQTPAVAATTSVTPVYWRGGYWGGGYYRPFGYYRPYGAYYRPYGGYYGYGYRPYASYYRPYGAYYRPYGYGYGHGGWGRPYVGFGFY